MSDPNDPGPTSPATDPHGERPNLRLVTGEGATDPARPARLTSVGSASADPTNANNPDQSDDAARSAEAKPADPSPADSTTGGKGEPENTQGKTTEAASRKSTDSKPADATAAASKAADAKATDGKATDGKAADGNAADGNAADGKSTDGNAADGKSTDGNAADGKSTDGKGTDGPGKDGKGGDGNGATGRERRRSLVTTLLSVFAVLIVVTAFGYFGGLGPLGRLSQRRELHAPDTLGGMARITDQQTRDRLELDRAAEALAQNNKGETSVEAYGDVSSETGLFVVIALRGKIDVNRVVSDSGATADQVQKAGESTCTTQTDDVVTCYRTSNTLTLMVRNSTGKAGVDKVAPITDEAFRAYDKFN